VNRKTFALLLGGNFLLWNVVRINAYTMFYNKNMSKELKDKSYDELLAIFDKQDKQVPDYLVKPVTQLSNDEKSLIREEFHATFNFPVMYMMRWMRDPRMLDGCDTRPMEGIRTRQRLMELAHMKTTAGIDGTGWNKRFYQTARECVFVYRNVIKRGVVDYKIWALLRNFGYDWTRATKLAPMNSLPIKVKMEAESQRLRHQKAGKR
jgi:hypothetical protein